MREGFQSDLGDLSASLARMCDAAATAMRQATQALLTADLALAEQVLAADADLDRQRVECETNAYSLLALQSPVAGDLRNVLAVVYCAEKVERMGDLAAHIADTTRYSHPDRVLPSGLEPMFTELGEITSRMADRVAGLVRSAAPGDFAELRGTDETVDSLHARILAIITGEEWQHGQRPAVAIALAARFYERFADQAVSVARRLEFAATGTLPK